MRIIELSMKGIKAAEPAVAEHPTLGKYYRFEHGESGRGRKLVFVPLNTKYFPVGSNYDWENTEFILEKRANNFYLLNKGGTTDNTFLVLWSLSPGYRGSAKYTLGENAQVIMEGREAQGQAGRMGGAPCPVVLVTGPTVLRWTRIGRIYGTPAHWAAVFDGESWTIRPDNPVEEQLELMLKGQL